MSAESAMDKINRHLIGVRADTSATKTNPIPWLDGSSSLPLATMSAERTRCEYFDLSPSTPSRLSQPMYLQIMRDNILHGYSDGFNLRSTVSS